MKVSERVGQLLDLSMIGHDQRTKIINFLTELNEEIPRMVMISRDMKNVENHINLYQDIKGIIDLIESRKYVDTMSKNIDELENRKIENFFKYKPDFISNE